MTLSSGKIQMARFDFGEYSEAAEAAPSKQLSWRDDPEQSLSDWTIVVSSAGEESTFHVHKAMLAAHHAQQSDYFKTEFAGSVSSLFMASSNRTRLDLEDSAAAAFPAPTVDRTLAGVQQWLRSAATPGVFTTS